MFSRKSAFTLTEVLIVTGVIGLLSGIVITAIRPKENLTAAYSARRVAQAQSIEKAINQMRVSTNPEVVAAVTEIIDSADLVPIQTCKYQASEASGCISLDALVDYDFLPEIPVDEEQSVESSFTGFTVTKTDAVTNPVVVKNPRVPPPGSETDCESRDYEEECEEEEEDEPEEVAVFTKLYWVGDNQIGEVDITTAAVTQLKTFDFPANLGGNARLALNTYDRNLYWTDNYEVYVAPTADLNDSEEYWSAAPILPLAFAFDGRNRDAYWLDDENFVSTVTGVIPIPSMSYPTNADIHDVTGILYWVDDNQHAVARKSLTDVTNSAETIVDSSVLNQPNDIFVDQQGGRLYLAKNGIYSTDLDGNDFQILSTLVPAMSVVVDSPNNKIYWADYFFNAIYQADLNDIDGTAEILVGPSQGVEYPRDLVGM